jgi:hypothetical protein
MVMHGVFSIPARKKYHLSQQQEQPFSSRKNQARMTANHPAEPFPTGIAKGRYTTFKMRWRTATIRDHQTPGRLVAHVVMRELVL